MPSPEIPLISRAQDDNVFHSCEIPDSSEDVIEQTLGGKTYSIDTSQFAVRKLERNKKQFWMQFLQNGAMLLATPVLIPTAALYAVSMYIGPSWFRNKMIYMLIRLVAEFHLYFRFAGNGARSLLSILPPP